DGAERERHADRMRGAAVAEGVRIGDAELEGQHVGVGQHRGDGAGGEQAGRYGALAGGGAEQEGDGGVGEDRGQEAILGDASQIRHSGAGRNPVATSFGDESDSRVSLWGSPRPSNSDVTGFRPAPE